MTDVASGLKLCPHCGDLARLIRDERIFEGQHYDAYPGQRHGFLVECAGSCHSMTCWWHTEAEAISAWNRRTDTAVVGEEAGDSIAERLQFALKHLAAAGAASCECFTKSPDYRNHMPHCRYYHISVAIEAVMAALARSPTGGREAGLEEAAVEWLAARIEYVTQTDTRVNLDRLSNAELRLADAARALLPSEQKARS